MARYPVAWDRSRKRPRDVLAFVCSIPLRCTPRQTKACETRFEVARLVYNAALGKCFRRVERIRSEPRWTAAQVMPRRVDGRPNPARSALYAELREDYDVTKRALASYGSAVAPK